MYVPVGNSHQNVEICSNIAVTPKEILVIHGSQSQGCKLLELIPKICISTMNIFCPRGFLYTPFLWL
jgi:hypothetical protein